jgi:hypothetical protein
MVEICAPVLDKMNDLNPSALLFHHRLQEAEATARRAIGMLHNTDQP